jgi:hypothetical protein
MGLLSGANGIISRLWVQSDATGEILLTENDFQRMSAVLSAVGYSAGGSALSTKAATSMTAFSPWVAQNLVRTAAEDTTELRVSIRLHDVCDMLAQPLPLNLLGLRLYLQLAPASSVFNSPATPAGGRSEATFEVRQPFLEGFVLQGADPASATINFTRLETLTQVVSSSTATITMSASNSAAALGCVMSFVPTAAMNNPRTDQSVLATPTGGVNGVSYRIGGLQSVLSYDVIPWTQNGSDNWSEAIDYALQLFSGLQGAKTALSGDRVVPNTAQVLDPNFFLLGVPFGSPQDLRRQPFSVQLATGITSAAPFLVSTTFISRATINVGSPAK